VGSSLAALGGSLVATMFSADARRDCDVAFVLVRRDELP
jgi:hypothetical protein